MTSAIPVRCSTNWAMKPREDLFHFYPLSAVHSYALYHIHFTSWLYFSLCLLMHKHPLKKYAEINDLLRASPTLVCFFQPPPHPLKEFYVTSIMMFFVILRKTVANDTWRCEHSNERLRFHARELSLFSCTWILTTAQIKDFVEESSISCKRTMFINMEGILCLENVWMFRFKAGSHVRHKHKHKLKKKYVRTGATQAY